MVITHYHQTVISNATPSGDFTKWCNREHASTVDVQQIRRERLSAYVATHFEGVLTQFANKIGYSQSQLNGSQRGKKSFGEDLAEKLEAAVKRKGLPPIGLPCFSNNYSTGSSPTPASTDPDAIVLSVLEKELIEVFRDLAPARRREIVKELSIEALRKARARPPSQEEPTTARSKSRAG